MHLIENAQQMLGVKPAAAGVPVPEHPALGLLAVDGEPMTRRPVRVAMDQARDLVVPHRALDGFGVHVHDRPRLHRSGPAAACPQALGQVASPRVRQ